MIRINRFTGRAGVFLAVLIMSLNSCRKEEEPAYKYLVSDEFVTSFDISYINFMLDYASNSYPEIDELRQYISTDFTVHKLIYETVVDDESINASGLVCIPSSPGEYPILCFQNGTNTLNSIAPTEYPLNPVLQMVEAVASMGYIVVIPDYPGFGESAQIAHPYLIAEHTVRSITDMLYSVNEFVTGELEEVAVLNEYYLLGYSQGGWATLSLHKALELDFAEDFNLMGSVCGAGPYNLMHLFSGIAGVESYPMPVYIGYIVNAYTAYNQFTNPVSDILAQPYATRLASLYTGMLDSDEINEQLTTSIPDLLTPAFLSGFDTSPQYSSVREALAANSISAWKTEKPLYLIHGGSDTYVNPSATDNIYDAMVAAGTSAAICTKEILPGLDHGGAVVPAMVKGLKFLLAIERER